MKIQTGRIRGCLTMSLLLAAGCSDQMTSVPPSAGEGVAGADGPAGGAGGASGPEQGRENGNGWMTIPPMAPALVVPAGATLAAHAHAEGAQIYRCTAAGADAGGAAGISPTYAWVLHAPDATLFDSTGAPVGIHGAGPSWYSNDGSAATGVKVIESPAPMPDAISWLLLRVSSTSGIGIFDGVSYVQRLSTTGGVPPTTACDATTAGTDVRSSYAAEYYFYRGGGSAEWLVVPASLPAAVAAPSGMTMKGHGHAIGEQIYACVEAGSRGYGWNGWTLKASNAVLTDPSFVPVGRIAAGPSWTWTDGSTIGGTEVAEVDSPLADAIPWLLLQVSSTNGGGELGDTAFVQRLNTAGGRTPTTPCNSTNANTLSRVPYSADYYFLSREAGRP